MKQKFNRLIYGGIILTSFVLLFSGWNMGFSGSKEYIDMNDIKIAMVETGEFSKKINGYGSLQSKNQRLITSSTQAIVDEIKLKPGAIVQKDTILLILKNPVLENKMQQALANLHNSKTTKRKIVLEQQREILLQESQLSQLKADTQMANLQVEAQSSLVESGVVSGMDAKRSELKAKQLKEQLSLEKKRLMKLEEVHKEYLRIQDDIIAQMEIQFNAAKSQLEQLVVKAGLKGILQTMSVTLGQSVTMGDKLALVGSTNELIAEIKVPQLQASLVRVGNDVEVDTRHGLVTGQVLRIDPVVVDGAVKVDVQLPKKLSAAIRPMQMVDATIFGKKRSNITSVQKPIGVTQDSQYQIFKLINEHLATRTEVKFGQISNNRIEVISGLNPGDNILIALPAVSADVNQIQLVSL
jgi:HlyD family secretion protein